MSRPNLHLCWHLSLDAHHPKRNRWSIYATNYSISLLQTKYIQLENWPYGRILMVQLRREQPNRKLSGTWRRVTRWTTCLPLAVAASHPATTLLTFTAAQTGAPTSSFDGTLLDGGNLATRNNVQEFADFALDLRDMRKNASDKQTVQNIYKQGSNAKSTDGSLISLQSLSEIYSSSTLLDVTPNILYHMYGLTSDMDPSSTLAARFTAIEQYQSSHIEKVILGDHTDLAADAVIALSMWTYATYLLHSTIWNCQVRTDADNPSVLVNNKELDHIDKFIALWMGSEQTSGNSDGHAMYDWVRRVNGLFGSTSPEAAVNTKIKLLYQEGATYLGLPDACTLESPKTVEALWNIAAQIIREMMKPLFQWLVYSLVVESPIESELYALALIPQLSRCRPSLYNRLAEAIRTGIQVSNKDSILRDLVEAYTSCLGHPCQDLSLASVSNDHPALSCEGITDDSTPPVLAGYRASSAVAPVSVC